MKVTRSKLRYHVKGLITRNTHVQYESPISSGKKVMAKVKVSQKKVTLQGQGHEVKKYGTMWKVLSQRKQMCNMKALSLLVRKLRPRLKFFKSRSNFKVKVTRSIIMVPRERSYHKEKHIWNMKALSLLVRKFMAKVKVFVHPHMPMRALGPLHKLPGHSSRLAKKCNANIVLLDTI